MSYPPPPASQPYPSAPPPGGGYGGPPARLRGRRPLQLSIIFFVIGIVLVIVGSIVIAKQSLG